MIVQGLNSSVPDASEIEESNALALAIIPSGMSFKFLLLILNYFIFT